MKSTSELTDFYYKNLYPTLQKLDEDREKVKKKIINIGVIYAVFVAIVCYLLFDYLIQDTDLFYFIGVVTIGIGTLIYKMLIKDYTSEFKEKIIAPLIGAIDENLTYSSDQHIPSAYFNRSELFTSSPDRINGNDYVRGKIDGIHIEFSDLLAEKRNRDSKGRVTWSEIFEGLFIVSEFNKHFHGKTVILPDTAQSTFGDLIGNWLQSKNLARDELVKMDDGEFEKEFVVYSTDQIEARYILSHSLMKRILDFTKRSKHPVYISFIDQRMYMAIYYDKDLFEPSVFHSLLKYKIAMEYVTTLHLAVSIVQELKLNQKLWSKR